MTPTELKRIYVLPETGELYWQVQRNANTPITRAQIQLINEHSEHFIQAICAGRGQRTQAYQQIVDEISRAGLPLTAGDIIDIILSLDQEREKQESPTAGPTIDKA